MKKTLLLISVFTITSLLFCFSIIAVDTVYETYIATSTEEFRVNDTFYIKAGINKITEEKGFVGLGIVIKYDPSFLSVVEENGVFVSETLPISWGDKTEKIINVSKKEDGNESGLVIVNYIIDLDDKDILSKAYKGDEFFINVKFKCVAPCDSTAIIIDGNDAGNACTALNEDFSIIDCKGKGSELSLSIKSDGSPEASEASSEVDNNINNDLSKTWIFIAVAVVVSISIVAVVMIVRRKK